MPNVVLPPNLPQWMVDRILNPAARPYRIPDTYPPRLREQILDAVANVAATDPLVRELAERIAVEADARARPGQCLSPPCADLRARAILRYVQSRPYEPDPDGQEWYAGLIYTIGYGGDCEELAALVVALARVVGIPGEVRWMDQPNHPLNHVTALLYVNGQWVWAEASVVGAQLGEHPQAAATRLAQRSRLGLAG